MPKINNTHRGGILRSVDFPQSENLNSQPKSQIFNLADQFNENESDFHPELPSLGLVELEKAQGNVGFLPTVTRQTKVIPVMQLDGTTKNVNFIQIVIDVDNTQYVFSTSSKAIYKFFSVVTNDDIMAAHQQNERLFVTKKRTINGNYKWIISREPPIKE